MNIDFEIGSKKENNSPSITELKNTPVTENQIKEYVSNVKNTLTVAKELKSKKHTENYELSKNLYINMVKKIFEVVGISNNPTKILSTEIINSLVSHPKRNSVLFCINLTDVALKLRHSIKCYERIKKLDRIIQKIEKTISHKEIDDKLTTENHNSKKIYYLKIAKLLKHVNTKRLNKTLINLTISNINLLGHVFSGLKPSNPKTSNALKNLAILGDALYSLFEQTKNLGREMTIGKDLPDFSKNIFDQKMSTAYKNNEYSTCANLILTEYKFLIKNINNSDIKERYLDLLIFINSTGCDLEKFLANSENELIQKELLTDAMKKN